MKQLGPILVFVVACHYVFVAVMSKLPMWKATVLSGGVLIGALFLFLIYLDMEEK